ncbi:hypothetical protein OG455_12570 [Kitasatospora sp. NBC_01287]|uniref:hypothetical protein n=1 Tax=Kitasatospora sp. NBC_01287 TaxID=2903573 RepID=UPI00225B8437|nr:hypothetical protein [Kitasatospora sp. NBC_01287]MCX4746350.1 hypothetical protein [Kitasatospora sp. NBC_01287]
MSAARPLAPWVRTRLRTSRAAALLLALLVLGTAFLAAALPRVLDRDGDQAVAKLLSAATPGSRSLTATTTSAAQPTADGPDVDAPSSGSPAGYSQAISDQVAQLLRGEVTQPLAPSLTEQTYGARTKYSRGLTTPGLPAPDGLPPVMNLITLHDQDPHLRLLAGHLPDAVTPGPGGARVFEVALAKPTADLLGVGVGAVLDTNLKGRPKLFQAVVTGIFQPNAPNEAFWSATPCLTGPCLESTPFTQASPPAQYWEANALVGPGQLDQLPLWGGQGELFWQLPIDPHHLHAYQLGQAQHLVSSILDGPLAADLATNSGIPGLRAESMLPSLLDQAQQQRAAVAPLSAIGPLGAGAVAIVVLLLAAGLAVDRRGAELSLLRARGGSLRAIGGRLLAETAVLVLPAALLGTALALLLLPAPRWTAAVLLGVLTGLVGLLPFPVRAVAMLRATGPRGPGRGGPAPARRARFARLLGEPRRAVAELAALALAAAAVLAARRRGVTPQGSSVDLLLSGAPVLLAVAGAVLLARLFPLLLAPGAHWAARRPGAIGFLGLARSTRGGGSAGSSGPAGSRLRQAPTVLPLMALMLAVATAGFGVTMLDSAGSARQLAVRQLVGGDARVMANQDDTLPAAFPAAAAQLPGLRTGTSVVVDGDAALDTAGGDSMAGAVLVIVDPRGYAALAQYLGYGQFDPAVLDGSNDAPSDPVPALISDNVAAQVGAQESFIQLPASYGNLRIKQAGSVHRTAAMPDPAERPVVIVSAAAVGRQLPKAGPLLAAPTEWFGAGSGISSAALRGLLAKELPAAPGAGEDRVDLRYTIATEGDYVQRLGGAPLQRSTERLFWSSILAAAGYSALSLLLSLLRAAPERAALLARLRTMGLRPRQGLTLILIEALPPALVAAVAGAGLSLLAVPLLGSAVNLSAMAGAVVPGGLRIAPGAVAVQALLLAALSCAVVVAETLLAGRRQINTELRAGDQR